MADLQAQMWLRWSGCIRAPHETSEWQPRTAQASCPGWTLLCSQMRWQL